MDTASTGRRGVAFCIDNMIAGLFMVPVWMQLIYSHFNQSFGPEAYAVEFRWVLLSQLMIFFYRWLFSYFLGGTIGKLLMGLRVVPARNPEKALGLFQSFLRTLADGLSVFFGQSLHVLALLRFDRTHVSDWVAETRVMQFGPRRRLPRRRIWLGLFLFFTLFWSSFQGSYRLIQQVRFESGHLVFETRD